MTKVRNALYIDPNGYAEIATPGPGGWRITTTRLFEGRYVRINDGRQYPQLCVGVNRLGNTISYENPEQLAADCHAKLYKTRAGFDRAAARLADVDPYV